jgi:hypothetical protein
MSAQGRDPDRIPGVLSAIEAAWREHPDWRLGQLVVNAAGSDPFHIEDDDLVAALKRDLAGGEG